ncbi:MAG: hypothetical protein AB7E47_09645 [Desulfovibrionaceae bacterium]
MHDPGVQVLLDFQDIAERLGVRYVLVGAGSRVLTVEHMRRDGRTVRDARATLDWDFGVQFEHYAAYEAFAAALIGGPFRKGTPWQRVMHKTTGIALDMVPFGGIAPGGTLRVPKEETTLQVLGFAEALSHAVMVPLAGRLLPVVNEVGFVVLKLIAWHDRAKLDDLRDLWHVIRDYDSGDNVRRAFDRYHALLLDDGLDQDEMLARLLGADMGAIMAPATRSVTEAVLSRLADVETMAVRSLARIGQPLDEIAGLFTQVLEGVKESPAKPDHRDV